MKYIHYVKIILGECLIQRYLIDVSLMFLPNKFPYFHPSPIKVLSYARVKWSDLMYS